MAELQTQDILGVDLLAAGGPYHGTGSPPEGDFYRDDDLRRIADDTNRLMATGELRAPVKLGHSREQRLLKESGFSDGEMPAAGWVSNVRAEDGKLKGDLMKVPSKLAELFKTGAFRTRSVELRSITSQQSGQKSGPVVSGLAWLGAKAPAVRSLDDVFALYSDQEPEEDGVTTVMYEDADGVVWNPEWGYRTIQAAIHTALTEGGASNYRVADIGPDRALVAEGEVAWVVPFSVDGNTVELAERSEWVLGKPDWAASAEHVREMCETGLPADTHGAMEITLTEEQVTAFAEKLGIDPDSFTVEDAVGKVDEIKALAEEKEGGIVVPADELSELRESAALAKKYADERFAEKRSALLTAAVEDGRINPGDMDKWVTRYNDNTDQITEILAEIPANDSYAREFGRVEQGDEAEIQLADAFDAYLGIETVGERG